MRLRYLDYILWRVFFAIWYAHCTLHTAHTNTFDILRRFSFGCMYSIDSLFFFNKQETAVHSVYDHKSLFLFKMNWSLDGGENRLFNSNHAFNTEFNGTKDDFRDIHSYQTWIRLNMLYSLFADFVRMPLQNFIMNRLRCAGREYV